LSFTVLYSSTNDVQKVTEVKDSTNSYVIVCKQTSYE